MPGISNVTVAVGFRIKKDILQEMDATAKKLGVRRAQFIGMTVYYACKMHHDDFIAFIRQNGLFSNARTVRGEGISRDSKLVTGVGIRIQTYILQEMNATAKELGATRPQLIHLAVHYALKAHYEDFAAFAQRNDVINNLSNYRYQ